MLYPVKSVPYQKIHCYLVENIEAENLYTMNSVGFSNLKSTRYINLFQTSLKKSQYS